MKTLRGKAKVKKAMWSRRAQEYEQKINSGDLIAIAEVVRDLHRQDDQREQSYSERQLYEAALERLTREFAAVAGDGEQRCAAADRIRFGGSRGLIAPPLITEAALGRARPFFVEKRDAFGESILGHRKPRARASRYRSGKSLRASRSVVSWRRRGRGPLGGSRRAPSRSERGHQWRRFGRLYVRCRHGRPC